VSVSIYIILKELGSVITYTTAAIGLFNSVSDL